MYTILGQTIGQEPVYLLVVVPLWQTSVAGNDSAYLEELV